MNSVPGCWKPGNTSLASVKVTRNGSNALRGPRCKQLVGMPAASTAPHDLQTLPGGDLLRPFLVAADILQKQRRPHSESGRQRNQGLQARSHMAGFEPA